MVYICFFIVRLEGCYKIVLCVLSGNLMVVFILNNIIYSVFLFEMCFNFLSFVKFYENVVFKRDNCMG